MMGFPQMLHALGAKNYHLLFDFLTAEHGTPAMLFLWPVSTVGKSWVGLPRIAPVLVGAVGMVGGNLGGEIGSLVAVSCAAKRLLVSTRSALVLVSALMVEA